MHLQVKQLIYLVQVGLMLILVKLVQMHNNWQHRELEVLGFHWLQVLEKDLVLLNQKIHSQHENEP